MKKRSAALMVVIALFAGIFGGSVLSGEPGMECIDFETFSPSANANPWVVDGVMFEVFDYNGTPTSKAEIVDWGGQIGLHCDYKTRIFLPHDCSLVEATLIHFVQPATMKAYTLDWNLVGTATMSGPGNVVETLGISGRAIRWVVIEAPQDETLLLEFCYSNGFEELPEEDCIDFKTFSPSANANPWVVDDVMVEVFDYTLTPTPDAEIMYWGEHIGLHCDFKTRIFLPHDCSLVEATLVHFVQPATMKAYTIDWILVGTATMSDPQDVVETLGISEAPIRWVVIEAPQDETLLLEFCYGEGLYSDEPTSSDYSEEPPSSQSCSGTVFIALLTIGGCTVYFRKK